MQRARPQVVSAEKAYKGDVIERLGRRYRVVEIRYGSWSGLKCFDCTPLGSLTRHPLVPVYVDEATLIRKRGHW